MVATVSWQRSDPRSGLANEKIHYRLQRFTLCCTAGAGLVEGAQLPVRARSARQDGADVCNLLLTSQHTRVLLHQGDQLLGKLRKRHQLAPGQIQEFLIETVA